MSKCDNSPGDDVHMHLALLQRNSIISKSMLDCCIKCKIQHINGKNPWYERLGCKDRVYQVGPTIGLIETEKEAKL